MCLTVRLACSLLMGLGLMLAACQPPESPSTQNTPLRPSVAVQMAAMALPRPVACEDKFVEHILPFANGARMREIRMYASNGAGVAVNDLDNDGDLDLAFASVDGPSTILWNEDGFNFAEQELADEFSHGVNSVDVDGDGWLDLVFTHRGASVPTFWKNLGERTFLQSGLTNVNVYAYSMAWADLNRDGALDLVTGSYEAELRKHGVEIPKEQTRVGTFYFQQHGNQFLPHQLDTQAQALAIGLVDLNQDSRNDIWIANDFALQDRIWLQAIPPPSTSPPAEGREEILWTMAKPFATTAQSTMSIEWGDIDNTGRNALLATDMAPYDLSPKTMAAWLPAMQATQNPHVWGDPQINANMLQVQVAHGQWRNEAAARGIAASGWSWAGKFGDLDSDGWLDAYIVNGMIALDLFGHLPNAELVEENFAYRNSGAGVFEKAPRWQLNSTRSGRGMAMADMDGDGDLDIVVNNLRSSATLYENRLCGGENVQVDLRWPHSKNRFAIGAQLALHTRAGTFTRDVRASSGYLSGDAARVHFGVPRGAKIEMLEIRWPDGAVSRIAQPSAQNLITISR